MDLVESTIEIRIIGCVGCNRVAVWLQLNCGWVGDTLFPHLSYLSSRSTLKPYLLRSKRAYPAAPLVKHISAGIVSPVSEHGYFVAS
jgi:hypothetical protein